MRRNHNCASRSSCRELTHPGCLSPHFQFHKCVCVLPLWKFQQVVEAKVVECALLDDQGEVCIEKRLEITSQNRIYNPRKQTGFAAKMLTSSQEDRSVHFRAVCSVCSSSFYGNQQETDSGASKYMDCLRNCLKGLQIHPLWCWCQCRLLSEMTSYTNSAEVQQALGLGARGMAMWN